MFGTLNTAKHDSWKEYIYSLVCIPEVKKPV